MDPQSVAFIPGNETWRLHNDLLRVQQIQADHSDRLLRLERRQDDDARMKSVWGGASPFPSVLSGTPQQAPLHHAPSDHFKDFDDESTNLIGSLHLDADEEPRRMGASSRANSVRFDESANQGHWSTHASRSSLDFMPRSTSSLGGLPLNERTSSHKSDGRASSVHSVRSIASGRASSLNLNLDAAYGLGDGHASPHGPDTPGVAPGLLILGSAPAIIRCWMNTNFKHDALHYAAICSGSYKSHLDMRLIRRLGYEDRVAFSNSGARAIVLPVYFPEAVPHPNSSRPSSPAPQVPSLTVEFSVIETEHSEEDQKPIQIIFGSDTLRRHNADILFSSNSMTLFDDDECKLSIPLVRPEDETTFTGLYTTGAIPPMSNNSREKNDAQLNGLGQRAPSPDHQQNSRPASVSGKYRPPGSVASGSRATSPKPSEESLSTSDRPSSSGRNASATPSRTGLGLTETRAESKGASQSASATSTSSPGIWSSWRRENTATSGQLEGSGAGTGKKQDSSYQRRDTGIKVLKPRTASRTFSAGSIGSPSAGDGRSRFFDDGKRRNGSEVGGEDKRVGAPLLVRKSSSKENQQSGGSGAEGVPKTRANPAGGASAFTWLNSGGSKQ